MDRAQLWVNNGQDCRITGLQDLQDRLFWLSCGLTMDRMAGLQDLQDKGFNKTNSGA